MTSEDCLAELAFYRLDDGGFKGRDGRNFSDWPDVLATLHGYWLSCCRGRPFPPRADIDPIDIPALLEYLVLIDVLNDPLDFRYRLVGGHIAAQTGRSLQGQNLRAMIGGGGPLERALQEKAMRVGEEVVRKRAPVCFEMKYPGPEPGRKRSLQGVLLPLGEPAEGPNMLLGGIKFVA
jgi:hypothetical protein